MAARLTCLALAFGAVVFSALAFGQGTGTGVLKLPQDIEFKGPLTGPPQTVMLYGDPTKAGVFVSRVKFSAGWKDPPHWHPDEVRTVVVLSGTLYFGSGDKWDESKFKAYPAGTFYSEDFAQNLVSVNLFLSFSDDSGVTWSKPKPIAGSVPANGVKRFWPVVTVSPGDASVNVVYYESLEQAVPGAPACNIAIGGGLRRVGPAHSLVNTILARSKDGGRTFGDPVTVSSVTSDWCAGTTNIRPNFGDYIGATTVGTTTFAVWADSRETILIGGTPRNVVDVFFAPVGEGQ